MNGPTQNLCKEAARYYQASCIGPDLWSVRAVWARGGGYANLAKIEEHPDPVQIAITAALPGTIDTIAHQGGLHLTIEGELWPGLIVDQHVKAIRESAGNITVRLNSGGGDLSAGFELAGALLDAGPERVSILVAGMAGSAASIILTAGNVRRFVRGSFTWVHRPSNVCWGTAADLRRCADELDRCLPKIIGAYSRICDRSLVEAWLADDVTKSFDSEQALAAGLATVIEEPLDPITP